MDLIKALNTQPSFIFHGFTVAVLFDLEYPCRVKDIIWFIVVILPNFMGFNGIQFIFGSVLPFWPFWEFVSSLVRWWFIVMVEPIPLGLSSLLSGPGIKIGGDWFWCTRRDFRRRRRRCGTLYVFRLQILIWRIWIIFPGQILLVLQGEVGVIGV